ncbi:MAG TPA: HNH endonuclease [Flavobacterium sp.]|nr:HNH endonuclease [Flavobacterium sp.]
MKKKRSPKWHRDELILTLNLYFDQNSGSFISDNPKIIALSKTLNKLPIHPKEVKAESFRNPNGVAMKLSNFTAIDPSKTTKGLESYSKLDEKTFFEFCDKLDELKRISSIIEHSLGEIEIFNELNKIEDEDSEIINEAFEGEIVYKLHKSRERNSKLIESKKKEVLKMTGKLECEVCSFDFYKTYGEIGKGFIECHHIKQLSTYQVSQKTKSDDLALVCSNCHRMLHRNRNDMSIKTLKNKLNQVN